MWFWRKQPLLKGYVSEIDRFLQEFDLKPEASSVNRRAEEKKYERITRLLSKSAEASKTHHALWADFNSDRERQL